MKKKSKNNKQAKPELIKITNEDTGEVDKFFLILVGVAIVTGLLYFVSSKYLIKDGVESEETVSEETIDYSSITGGTLFNRPEEEYYVMAVDSESNIAPLYTALARNMDSKKGTIYIMDLANDLNKKFTGEKSNSKASNPNELSLTNPTLIKIKSGKISKYLDTKEEIKKELK